MKSAFECFQEAAKCEEMAADAQDMAAVRTFLGAALQWRELGEMLQSIERDEVTRLPQPTTH